MHVPSRSPLSLLPFAASSSLLPSFHLSFLHLPACSLLIPKPHLSVSLSLSYPWAFPSFPLPPHTLSPLRVALHSLSCTSASLAPVFNPAKTPISSFAVPGRLTSFFVPRPPLCWVQLSHRWLLSFLLLCCLLFCAPFAASTQCLLVCLVERAPIACRWGRCVKAWSIRFTRMGPSLLCLC